MGRQTRQKELRRLEADRSLTDRLVARSRFAPKIDPVTQFSQFPSKYRDAIKLYRRDFIRSPEDWRCTIKSKRDDRRFLQLVRFTFARYPVAWHLEEAWLDDCRYRLVDQVRAPERTKAGTLVDLRRWYIIAASGGSLYRKAMQRHFTKAEGHFFLNAPRGLGSSREAFWYAVARACGADQEAAIRIGRTKLTSYSAASVFWKEVARFFARNPTSLAEMNDLIDYMFVAKEEDRRFTLKDRTIESLRRRMDDWHRTLRRQQAVCGGSWIGRPIPDVDYAVGSEQAKAVWHFRQIKTGNDLYLEGQHMHHCVSIYKSRCIAGDVSIWSLRSEYPIGKENRGVTIEVRSDGTIVQCRGFANRLPHSNEVTVVKRWAQDHDLRWSVVEAW